MRMRHVARKMAASYPIYRALPSGRLRTYAELWYRNARSQRHHIVGVARTQDASRYLSSGLVAARAAFDAAQDDVVDDLLADLVGRFPHAPAIYELRAGLSEFRGRYADALGEANRARLLEPSRASAVARVVRLSYRVKGRAQADDVALAALRRRPLSQSVLWAVGKSCSSPDQARRIIGVWHEAVPEHSNLPKVVWQLATAAARGGLAMEACELYREAIVALHKRPGSVKAPASRVLQGKCAGAAIQDLVEVLDSARIPFFFAAGTTLGLVREGRPLALDSDIDVGVLDADWNRDTLVELFRKDPRFIIDPNPMSQKVGLKHRGGSPIDIFRYYEEDGKVWHDGVFVRWANSPFDVARREINGLMLPVPADVDRYLTENYGDWRVPNPGYDVFTEAPNAHVHWPEYAHMHLLRRAFRALRAGQRESAIRDLTAAAETELTTVLDSEPASHPGEEPILVASSEAENDRLSVDEVLVRARAQAAAGDRERALGDLEAAIRDRRWLRAALWDELVSMARPGDHDRVMQLWFDSPARAHKLVAILRAVAVSAIKAGDVATANALLVKAVLLSDRRARRPRAVARRAFNRVRRWRRHGAGLNDQVAALRWDGIETPPHLDLLDAVINRRKEDIRRFTCAFGERQPWLDSLS
jgi:tetratricopeptide (TPR) repeat protein